MLLDDKLSASLNTYGIGRVSRLTSQNGSEVFCDSPQPQASSILPPPTEVSHPLKDPCPAPYDPSQPGQLSRTLPLPPSSLLKVQDTGRAGPGKLGGEEQRLREGPEPEHPVLSTKR